MGQAFVFGSTASAALVLGAAVGSFWKPPQWLTATALAFAGGALVSALAFELFGEANRVGGIGWAAGGMLAGATTFIVLDARLLKSMRGGTASLALLAAVTLDGIPENLALGISLTEGASYALLVAIFASNFPEALGSAVDMRGNGRSTAFILGIWVAAGVLLAAAVVAGSSALEGASGSLTSVLLGFAAGAVLASLADTVFPEAFDEGGPYVAFATVVGFLVAFVIAEG